MLDWITCKYYNFLCLTYIILECSILSIIYIYIAYYLQHIGLTTQCPDDIDTPTYFQKYFSSPNYWILLVNAAYNYNQKKQLTFNLNDLSVGQSIGCSVTSNGELHCYIDGKFQCVGWTGLPTDRPYWGVADVYRPVMKIKSEFVYSKFINYYDIYT